MSQIFIIGANGKVGRHAARLLQDSEHDVKVGLRSKDQFSDFEKLGHTPVHLDLEADVATITMHYKDQMSSSLRQDPAVTQERTRRC